MKLNKVKVLASCVMYPASKVSFDLPSQEAEGNSASSFEKIL